MAGRVYHRFDYQVYRELEKPCSLPSPGVGVPVAELIVEQVRWTVADPMPPPTCACSIRIPPGMSGEDHFAWMRAVGFDLLP